MKRTILAVILSSLSVSAFAADSFNDATAAASTARTDKNQAAFDSAVSDTNAQKALNNFNSPNRFNSDGSFNEATGKALDSAFSAQDAAHAAQDKANAASIAADAAASGSAMRAQVSQQQAALALTGVNQTRTQQQVNALATAQTLNSYGVKGNPNLTAQVNQPNTAVSYSGTSTRPATGSIVSSNTTTPTGSINVAVTSVKPNTPVSVSIQGKTVQTTAGELAKVDPNVQVAIPHTPALIVSQRQGSDHSHNSSHEHGGTGNGGNNAANSNSAHGLGGGNHIGGGSAQSGSRNVGHW